MATEKVIYRTWPLLEKRLKGKRPTDYQITTYKLHYHFQGHDKIPRLELDPNYRVVKWFERYRERSPFRVDDWDDFEDPNQTVYWTYNIRGDDSENFIDYLLEEAEVAEYDRGLDKNWLLHLKDCYGPMRYPYHALAMVSNYIACMSPASSLTNAHTFEGMDNLRILQRIAYRTKMLDKSHPDIGFGREDQKRWEEDAIFQPLREAVEKMLVVYDFGESFSALNLVLKPLLDELFLIQFADLALAHGDHILAEMQGNFYLDTLRTQRWVKELARFSIERNGNNKPLLEGWVEKWFPLAWKGVEGFRPVFEKAPKRTDFKGLAQDIRNSYGRFLGEAGLKAPF
mgnify:CR=1 FL=1